MKKFFKKTWFWMLSGVAMLLGTIFQSCSDISTLYGPPKVYGPPPPEMPNDTV